MAAAALPILYFAWTARASKKEQEEACEQMEEDIKTGEGVYETVAIGARAIAKTTAVLRTGRSHNIAFYVTFLTDELEEVVYDVPEEAWETIHKDQTGTLVTVGGRFFAFGDGEEI